MKQIINEQNIGIENIKLPSIQLSTTKRVAYFKSESQKKIVYRTERARTGNLFCTCPSFMYRRTCRHVEQAKNWK